MFTRTKKLAIIVLAVLSAGIFTVAILATTRGQPPATSRGDVLYIGEQQGNVPVALALDSDTMNLTRGISDNVTATLLADYEAMVQGEFLGLRISRNTTQSDPAQRTSLRQEKGAHHV